MSLNDAYDFVRRKKSNISPNFNFMGQLLDFERQLNPPSPQRCTCHLSAGDSGNKPEDHALIPFTRLSIEEPEDEEELPLSADPTSMGIDSGLPSSVSMSPCSAESSVASSPAVIHSSPSGGGGSGNVKRLRTLVCRCQASLSQCILPPRPLCKFPIPKLDTKHTHRSATNTYTHRKEKSRRQTTHTHTPWCFDPPRCILKNPENKKIFSP